MKSDVTNRFDSLGVKSFLIYKTFFNVLFGQSNLTLNSYKKIFCAEHWLRDFGDLNPTKVGNWLYKKLK